MKARLLAPRRSSAPFPHRSLTTPEPCHIRRIDRLRLSVSFSTGRHHQAQEEQRPIVPQNGHAKERAAEREFFLSVLSSTATKRDAKTYLSRFQPPEKTEPEVTPKVADAIGDVAGRETYNSWRLSRTGVNLGGLYGPTRAIEETPVFAQQSLPERFIPEDVDPLHVAVVKIRSPQLLDEDTLSGVGLTLSQLTRLGLNSAVVLDCDEENTPEVPDAFTRNWRDEVTQQAGRLVSGIGKHNAAGARIIDQALAISKLQQEVPSTVHVRGGVEVWHRELVMSPLRRGMVPVMLPVAYAKDTLRAVRVQPDDVVLALTREFAGLTSRITQQDKSEDIVEQLNESVTSTKETFSLDRIIVLDPLGGIPASDRADNAHVFINLEQEYRDVREELSQAPKNHSQQLPSADSGQRKNNSIFGASNPFSKFVEDEVAPLPSAKIGRPELSEAFTLPKTRRHIKNLDLVQRTLALLPPSSSALITTPAEAASSARAPLSSDTPGVATRRQKNPLIYNLLTDKPLISASLPMARLTSTSSPSTGGGRLAPATFVKRGMPLTIIPDLRHAPWTAPGPEGTSLSLDDPRIDFPRLLHLIEDSFNRPLDVPHYLNRIRNRLAGIIIAGEYEGGAILTWEDPPPPPPNEGGGGSAGAGTRPPIPYLDKFAVLQRSQGAGGVADVVFNAMVRSCFPDGVVWRSRWNNPVNRWYFERAMGSWRIPGSQWTMFWTGPVGVERDGRRWREMVGVCAGIGASWRDAKPAD